VIEWLEACTGHPRIAAMRVVWATCDERRGVRRTMRYMILLGALSAIASGQTVAEWMTLNGAAAKTARLTARLQGSLSTAAQATPTPASAATNSNSPVVRQQIVRAPVTWTLSTSACPALTSTTKGTGSERETITIAKNSDGTYNYALVDEVNGTA